MSPTFEKRASIKGLVMTRRQGQQIVINHGELRIEIVQVKGSYVKLCFSANKEISILRGEVAKTLEQLELPFESEK